jgi:hypothetical protein
MEGYARPWRKAEYAALFRPTLAAPCQARRATRRLLKAVRAVARASAPAHGRGNHLAPDKFTALSKSHNLHWFEAARRGLICVLSFLAFSPC